MILAVDNFCHGALKCVMAGLIFSSGFCQKNQPMVEMQGQALGAKFSIKYIADNSNVKASEVSDFIQKFFVNLQDKTSLFQSDSELIRINNESAQKWIPVSDDLGKMIFYALDLSQKTEGYYDITSGSLSKIWPTGNLGKLSFDAPDLALIEKARSRSGYKNILIKKDQSGYLIFKKLSGMTLDLASLSAGFGADEIARYFESRGIKNYLIDAGGEIRASGLSHGKPWIVGIEDPFQSGKTLQRINLRDKSIATSGSYKNYLKDKNQKYSHIIDPHTGRPVQSRLILLSVIQNDCMAADALATALFAMGEERAWNYALKNNIPVFMVVKTGIQNFKTRISPGYDFEK